MEDSSAIGVGAHDAAMEFSRGVGVYPGAPWENFNPSLVVDRSTYRNLALLRPAYHSSSYDYNLTAQLVTDGITSTTLPNWVAVSTSTHGVLSKNEREVLLDHFPTNTLELRGARVSAQIEVGGGTDAPAVDRIAVFAVIADTVLLDTVSITLSVSEDGREWKEVGHASALKTISGEDYPPDLTKGSLILYPTIPLTQICRSRKYKVECAIATSEDSTASPAVWRLGQVEFYDGPRRVEIGGPYDFTSAWKSAGLEEEWVYVDLGARCTFNRVKLHWIARAAEGALQVSQDASVWRTLQPLPGGSGQLDDIRLRLPARARYLRVLMTRPPSPDGYMLSEIEVYGRGGPVARPKPAPLARDNGRRDLAGGNWRLQRSNLVDTSGESLSRPDFKDSEWVVATVPGTVLSSYLNVEAVPDPNFGQNQLHISDSFFYSDFWYRNEFDTPAPTPGQMTWLNFDGVNWKAEVFLNGEKLGRIEGGFMRGRFNVSGKLLHGNPNVVAVCVEKNATPGSVKQKTLESAGKNGGGLGADNPTYHAAVGWDWIPTIRGRDTGIWGDVFLTTTGVVTLEDPLVSASLPLPDTSRADVNVEVVLVNHQATPVSGVLRGNFGEISFEQAVTIEGFARKKIKISPATDPALRLHDPKLWWPTGYGDPHLYDVSLAFHTVDQKALDRKTFKVGVRQFSYSQEGGALKMWINGRRFIARGGNWGFSESMLRYRAREYDAAVRYHREMNFTMIRNWVGQIGDDAFYEACDRHGIVVWQDFWLANPWDGPIPADNTLFLSNTKDLVLRIRNHASVGLYCGRNEGFPPAPLEDGIRTILSEYHPGLLYIPSSADQVVSGHGPYRTLPAREYFRIADPKLHSEMGMPNIPPIESVRAMMPERALWPRGLDWGLHDFCLQSAQGTAGFVAIVDESYGGANTVEEWVTLAQFVNYEGYRAMFEAQSKYRMGLLLWMSHPCWPSFVWQTYDYYLEPTAAYFGCKKGSEPLHIQWNRETDSIEVVNYSAGSRHGLTARVEILNIDGKAMWTTTASLDSAEDSTTSCISMEYPSGLTPVHLLRLSLSQGEEVISQNDYLRALEEGNYRALRQLPKVKLSIATKSEHLGNRWLLNTQLENTSPHPAVMVRLKAIRESSGDRILPAIYSDNYVTLMPGERRTIQTQLSHADTRGEKPQIAVLGFNV